MDAMDSGDNSDHDTISMDMLGKNCDRSQSHPNINKIEARYKICDCIRQRQSEWKVELKATRNMGKGSHKVFKTVVKEIFKICHHWENLVQRFPISFQNLETFLK